MLGTSVSSAAPTPYSEAVHKRALAVSACQVLVLLIVFALATKAAKQIVNDRAAKCSRMASRPTCRETLCELEKNYV